MDYETLGKRIKQYRTYSTLPAARAGLRDFLSRREKELQSPHHQMTLSQWLEYWMETIVRPNRAETTVYAYQKIIDNHLGPALGDKPLLKLTPRDIQQYYINVQRELGLSSNTMRRHHDLLSSSFRAAVRQDMLAYSPMDRVEPPRSKLYEADFYNPEELKRLYSLLQGHWLELPVKLAGSLGLRREELCGLKWENVSFQRRVIYIREARTAFGATIVQKETKNRSSMRTLYMPEDIARLLAAELERQHWQVPQAPGHVVLDHKGQPYSPNALSLSLPLHSVRCPLCPRCVGSERASRARQEIAARFFPFSLPHPQSGLQETLEIDLAHLDPARRTLMIRNIPNR